MIHKIVAAHFTNFETLKMDFSSGINVLIGENGTGKTHIMKAIYSACCVIDERVNYTFDQKLFNVFLPNTIGRLVRRTVGRSKGFVSVYRKDGDGREKSISCEITSLNSVTVSMKGWKENMRNPATYIPVKDMLANAQGFRSLYANKNLYFEEIYSDIIDKALLPAAKGKQSNEQRQLLAILSNAISGKVVEKNERFYLKNSNGELEFTLLAEGFRKLGLLYSLIQNETLTRGSVLFWDEPEANLNPKLANTVVNILLELEKMGVQIFIATHDYVMLKEFDLAATNENKIRYHTLFHTDGGNIGHFSTEDFNELTPNAIDDAYTSMLDREIDKSLQ